MATAADKTQDIPELEHTVKRAIMRGASSAASIYMKYAAAILVGVMLAYGGIMYLNTHAAQARDVAAAIIPPAEVEVKAPAPYVTDVNWFREHGIFHDPKAWTEYKIRTSNGEVVNQHFHGNGQRLRLREDKQGYTWEGYDIPH